MPSPSCASASVLIDAFILFYTLTPLSYADPENISTVASLLMTDRVYVFDNSLPSRYVMCTFPRNCLLSSASLAYTPRCRTSLPVTMSTVYVPPARFVHD